MGQRSLHNTVLQIYQALFIQRSLTSVTNVTKLLQKCRGPVFIGTQCRCKNDYCSVYDVCYYTK